MKYALVFTLINTESARIKGGRVRLFSTLNYAIEDMRAQYDDCIVDLDGLVTYREFDKKNGKAGFLSERTHEFYDWFIYEV